jgi:hypothetical protein
MAAQLLHADGRDEANSRSSQFCERPKQAIGTGSH